MEQKFRHEYKHSISPADMTALRMRSSAVMRHDSFTVGGKYFIRSLYFDNLFDKALLEKLNGVNQREKFRIRYYNGDTSFIRLEKKSKFGGLSSKLSAPLTYEQADLLAHGIPVRDSRSELVDELAFKMDTQLLKPKTIVDYTREAFVYPAGNVRVTLDYNIRTGMDPTELRDRPLGREHYPRGKMGRISPLGDKASRPAREQADLILFQIRRLPYLRINLTI